MVFRNQICWRRVSAFVMIREHGHVAGGTLAGKQQKSSIIVGGPHTRINSKGIGNSAPFPSAIALFSPIN